VQPAMAMMAASAVQMVSFLMGDLSECGLPHWDRDDGDSVPSDADSTPARTQLVTPPW